MDTKAAFFDRTGARYFLHLEQPEELVRYLRNAGWLESSEIVCAVSRPGEGNMNHVLRVRTDRRSLIIKQSRPWVEKFPQIEAPVERVLIEAAFYKLVERVALFRAYMPKVLGSDPDNYVLLLEDLGKGADCTFIYRRGERLAAQGLARLLAILGRLHSLEFSEAERRAFPDNLAMRRLNHQHLFVFPLLEDNGLNLDQVLPGLQAAAQPFRRDPALRRRMTGLGEHYLGSGPSLLHGDYFPGSWLHIGSQIKIIDPEFCFFGPPEYDLGVAIAHLLMARTPADVIALARQAYTTTPAFDEDLRRAFTGMELLRRLIGLAQLPVDLSLEERVSLLEDGRRMVVG